MMPPREPAMPPAARELAALWTRAQPTVRGFVYSLTHDRQAAEDIVQDVAVTAVDKFAELENREAFLGWVLAIARYKVLNHRTAAARDRHVFDDAVLDGLAAAHERLAPLAAARRAALAHCIDKLDDRGRDAVHRKYTLNQSAAEMADDMDIQPNTVYQLLHRVRRNLLDCITQQLESEESGHD